MKGIYFLTKKINYESGVLVSLKHMCTILKEEQIPFQFDFYEDDQDLMDKVLKSSLDVINIHVPIFQDETLLKLLETKKQIYISIHSTLCNLQVEEDALNRMLKLGNLDHKNLHFTCPSKCEVVGFNAVMKRTYHYLPNTFSYQCDHEELEHMMHVRTESLQGPVKISLISAYRPFKNMVTQMAAIALLAKEREVEVHLVDSNLKTPVYHALLQIANNENIPVVMYQAMNNKQLFKAISQVHVGMQVSLSETFSYVAMEHMFQGIPMIGSDSVPYANEHASYSDVCEMYEALKRVIESKEQYDKKQQEAIKKSREIVSNNRQDMLLTILDMMRWEDESCEKTNKSESK